MFSTSLTTLHRQSHFLNELFWPTNILGLRIRQHYSVVFILLIVNDLYLDVNVFRFHCFTFTVNLLLFFAFNCMVLNSVYCVGAVKKLLTHTIAHFIKAGILKKVILTIDENWLNSDFVVGLDKWKILGLHYQKYFVYFLDKYITHAIQVWLQIFKQAKNEESGVHWLIQVSTLILHHWSVFHNYKWLLISAHFVIVCLWMDLC